LESKWKSSQNGYNWQPSGSPLGFVLFVGGGGVSIKHKFDWLRHLLRALSSLGPTETALFILIVVSIILMVLLR